jgi:hypothetical protein
MAYTQEKKDECFDWIISEIESGKSLISTLSTNGMPSTSTFYIWLEEKDENGEKTEEAKEKSKRYACACEARELRMLDEIIEIADKQGEDIIHTDSGDIVNHNVIGRNRLQVEARKWVLEKLNPKKYSNRIDHTTNGEAINNLPTVLQVEITKPNED